MSIRLLDNMTFLSMLGQAPAANTITFYAGDFARLNNELNVGDVVYLVATDSLRQEVVKYTHAATLTNPTVVVARGQLGTTAKSWAAGTCWRTTLTEGVLNALICQKINQGC